MLISLYIKNFILIDFLEINFKKGLTSIVGETGAGKSIILKALLSIFAKKASSSVVKDQSKATSITVEFDISNDEYVINYLFEKGFLNNNEKTLIIRKVISFDSKNKIFINDQPTTIDNIKAIEKHLCEICSQHNQVKLLDSGSHVEILDNYINSSSKLNNIKNIYQKILLLKKEFNELQNNIQKNEYEKAYLLNKIKELEELNISENESEELSIKRKNLLESSKILDISQSISKKLIAGDSNIISELWLIQKQLNKYANVFIPYNKNLESIILELETFNNELTTISQNLIDDTENIEEIEGRYFKIKEAEKKYKADSSQFYSIIELSKTRLQALEDETFNLEQAEKNIANLKKDYFKYAKELSDMRKQASQKLREKLIAITKNLNMEQLDLKIDIVTTELITPKGIDIVQILIKTNPEQNFESIDKIASGGEISRIMLALKLVSSSHYDNKTIIFDEIDSGTGGKTAKMIGINLKELSKNMQVILITHQPQIAAISDNIFKVTKEFESNKTVLNARYLQKHEIESEISYMISGEKYDKKAKNTTQTLLLKGQM